jgi:hypothetical protein
MTAREIRSTAACPTCKAPIGEPCTEKGRRVAAHPERIRQAEMVRHWRAGTAAIRKATRQQWREARYRRR